MNRIKWNSSNLSLKKDIIDVFIDNNEYLKGNLEFQGAVAGVFLGELASHIERKYQFTSATLRYLDKADIRGDLLEKYWKYCGGTAYNFYRITPFIEKILNFEMLQNNLKLDRPVEMFSKEFLNLYPTIGQFYEKMTKDDETTYKEEIKKSFIDKYNKEVLEEKAELPLIKNQKPKVIYPIDNNETLMFNDLYFGGIKINVCFDTSDSTDIIMSWFQKKGNYWKDDKAFRVLKSLPTGISILVDDKGSLVNVDKACKVSDKIIVLPNKMVKNIEFSSIRELVKKAKQKLQAEKGSQEVIISVSLLEKMVGMNCKLKVRDLKVIQPVVETVYEFVYGKLFDAEKILNK